jgi:hypothetical protein
MAAAARRDMRPRTALLASALTAKGIATWYIEYRVVGDKGGGWPGTFLRWGSAVDHLRALAKAEPIDLSHVVAVGHLAGALAAFWSRLVTNCRRAVKFVEDPLPVQAAVAINGPGDIAAMIGADVNVCDLRALPLGVPQYFVASKVLSTEAANTLLGSGYRKRRHGRDPRRRQ